MSDNFEPGLKNEHDERKEKCGPRSHTAQTMKIKQKMYNTMEMKNHKKHTHTHTQIIQRIAKNCPKWQGAQAILTNSDERKRTKIDVGECLQKR